MSEEEAIIVVMEKMIEHNIGISFREEDITYYFRADETKTILNYIDKLQRREEMHRDTIRYCLDIMSEYDTDIVKLQKENEELKADKNKLINYIAIREDKTHEEVCKEFELGE